MTLRRATCVDTLKIKQMILIGQETTVELPLGEQVPVQIIPTELKKVLVHCTYKMSSRRQQAKNFYKFSIKFCLTYQQVLSDSWDCTLPISGSGAMLTFCLNLSCIKGLQ